MSLTPYAEVRHEVPAGRFLELDGHSVYVEDRGPESSTADRAAEPATAPVVLVHGFGASSFSWRRVVERLPEHRTVALDLRGFGYTERPPGIAPYTREGQVELIRAVLDRLGIERAHLVGHSYGGAVSMAFAARYPQRLRSLTLIDAAHPEYPRRRRTRLASARPLVDLYVRAWALRPWLVRRALEASVADDSVVTRPLVEEYLRRLRVEGASRAYYGVTAPTPDAAAEEGAVDLSAIRTPTLVVWGEKDRLIPVERGREASAALPCHRFVALSDVGHMPMEEEPEELAARLRDFLSAPGAVCERSGSGDTTR